ncbi:urea ABC transporter ATP-binding protein UrtD [Spirulina major CS-329]|uniref:urea ABC transporter ATP-binding protein UrtD n=1 Tax=Spirulina TaxID=1154 RepID=UPI00232EEE95|nr:MULTISPECIES: urea ABC transporter ATP-binding protein UrtD [Spirulina]MDB9495576.1 urea ABC transporter ATP-binding protein UrtD [Spirulina subsalsa CS-330]MDB9503927.1 urea ABC transporter ATP-binding protein UrtD [Spirulina major CS-329]
MPQPILEIDHLTVSFDGFKALNNLTFAMQPGELRVIIGPNGAGKTTFLDIITGKVQPTSGSVRFKGRDLRKLPEHTISRLGVGRKFQTPRVYLNLTVRENLDLACNRNKNVLATLFKKPEKRDRATVIQLLETVSLASKADLPANLLSHGEKQRLEIGMLVAQSPELLLVDEPVAGLTDEETERVGDLLISLAQSHSIIVIEHDMEFVRQIARQVTVLHQGSVLCEGSMDEIQDDPRVIEVYLGQAPTISPSQLRILRIAAAMAWADGYFAPEQLQVILTRLSRKFAPDPTQQDDLRQELQNYLSKETSLESLIPQLETEQEKEQVLKLCYEIIRANTINEQESVVYQKLLELLNLPDGVVSQTEEAINLGMTNGTLDDYLNVT